MIREEMEFHAIDNRGDDKLVVSSTHPVWTRRLDRLEKQGLARRTRTITAIEDGEHKVLGAEWALDREKIALRLTPRRRATEAQRTAAAKGRASLQTAHSSSRTDALARDSIGSPKEDDPRAVQDASSSKTRASQLSTARSEDEKL